MPVSLCLIVKDEARNLKKCLDSFRPLCDEIIVVDTGSTDETQRIAKRCGAKVFEYRWTDDFSAARNFAINHATQEWVMVADADDVIETKPLNTIKAYLKKVYADTIVIFLPYVYTKTEAQDGQTTWLPRLWRRSMHLKYIYPVHEYLDLSSINPHAMATLDAPILHQKPNHDFRPGLRRNLKILVSVIQQNPHDLRLLYYLVHDSLHLGQYEESLRWSERYLAAKPNDSIHLSKVFTMQGMCYLGLDQPLLAQSSFLLALGANPLLIEPYLELGDLNYRQNRLAEAAQWYRLAELCEIPSRKDVFFNRAAYDFFAARKLAYLLPMMGRPKEALEYAQKVLRNTPDDNQLKALIQKLKKADA